MGLSCMLGFHDWKNCKCTKCSKIRDEGHDWSKDCMTCSKCGISNLNDHQWKGCKCIKCGKTRDEDHDWRKDCMTCSKCGSIGTNAHQWVGCKCIKCGKTRDEDHDWSNCKCIKCGKTRDEYHDWNICKCIKCGKTRDEYHDWSKNCEKCSKCGTVINQGHDWRNDCEKCVVCGDTYYAPYVVWDGCMCSECVKETNRTGHIFDKEDLTCIKCNKQLDVNVVKLYHRSPLHLALEYKEHRMLADRLIDKGANIDIKDDYGQSPLYHAARYGCDDIVTLLISKGAFIDPTTNDGWTPLYTAICFEKYSTVELLISKGANTNLAPLFEKAYSVYKEAMDAAANGIAGKADNKSGVAINWLKVLCFLDTTHGEPFGLKGNMHMIKAQVGYEFLRKEHLENSERDFLKAISLGSRDPNNVKKWKSNLEEVRKLRVA